MAHLHLSSSVAAAARWVLCDSPGLFRRPRSGQYSEALVTLDLRRQARSATASRRDPDLRRRLAGLSVVAQSPEGAFEPRLDPFDVDVDGMHVSVVR